jgi:inward rectifier potassium channel
MDDKSFPETESLPVAPPEEQEGRDLGFGSVVAIESRKRLLNKDGTFNVDRKGLSFWSSLSIYHWLLTISWTKFFALICLFYLFVNLIFAEAYYLCGPGAITRSGNHSPFFNSFFFSVQTLATIGYGKITPESLSANVLVTLESLVGLLGFALAAGLLFARFSRPSAQIIFSRVAVIAPYRGITAFEFRIANERKNQIIELEAKVLFSRIEVWHGKAARRFYELPLERRKVVFFPLSWTIVHPISNQSPLYGKTQEDLAQSDGEFDILLTGIDETFSQTVHARSSYKPEEVVWGAKFSNIFIRAVSSELIAIDISRLHSIERVELESSTLQSR